MSDGFGMTMNVDTERLEQIIAELPNNAEDFLAAVATEMVGDIIHGMDTSPADGLTYWRGNVVHIASSPGNPPVPDTGELRASIDHRKTGVLEQTIHDGVEYGRYLELGTEFIEPRPFFVPVFEDWRVNKFGQFVRDYPLVT